MINKVVALLLFSVKLIVADQPVKCPKNGALNYVGGTWTFQVGPEETVNLYQTKEVCTHNMPNSIQVIGQEYEFMIENAQTWTVKITDDKNVQASGPSSSYNGEWDIIFDQSLVVILSNGQRFVTNFQYKAIPDAVIQKDPAYMQSYNNFMGLGAKTFDRFTQNCDKTMVGFVQTVNAKQSFSNHKIQCFIGSFTPGGAFLGHQVAAAQQQTKPKTELQKLFDAANLDEYAESVPQTQELQNLVQYVNKNNLGWKAKSPIDHQQLSQKNEKKVAKFGHGKDFKKAIGVAQKFRDKYSKASQIKDSEIPAQYDLRNVAGHDFTGLIRKQGHCGSCHAMAFVQAVESRLKVKYGKDVGGLSVQQMLKCNYMTEGCKGGWAIMHGWLAENGEIVSDECAPYATEGGASCRSLSSCKGIARVSKTYALEKPTVQMIQKEILYHGAVVTDWAQPKGFGHIYSSGVVGGSVGENGEISHASVLIGWGQENGKDYWILRNSYGDRFGMNSVMFVERGVNAMRTEEAIVGFDVELLQ